MMADPRTFAQQKEKEREAKKGIIVRAAIGVFSEKSLREASLRDIAEAAGISHPTIYRYFEDKQSLFVEAFAQGAEELIDRLESVLDSQPPESLLEALAETFMGYLLEHEHYFTMMTQFMLDGSLSADSVARLNTSMKAFLDTLEKGVRLAGGAGNPRYLAHSFFASLNGILITFHKYPGRSREELTEHMKTLTLIYTQMFRDGLLAGNYHRHIQGGAL
jgi:AcrR family transcriptional regulator